MPDRREFLKYFGIGSVIAPVAASELHARLIEPPKVELVEPPKVELADMPVPMPPGGINELMEAFLYRLPVDCTISFGVKTCPVTFTAFLSDMRMDHEDIEVTAFGDDFRRFLPRIVNPGSITLRILEGPGVIPATAPDRTKRARRQPAE